MTSDWAPLVDVRGMTIQELAAAAQPGSPINAATLRLIAELDDPDGVISAFQSYIE